MTDSVLKIIEHGNEDERSDMELAMRIGELLEKTYPNHPWLVCVQGYGIVIRHLAIASEFARVIGREGFASLLPRDKLWTPKEVRHSVITFAGELLEAFSLPRGAWDGRLPIVPDWKNHQDSQFH